MESILAARLRVHLNKLNTLSDESITLNSSDAVELKTIVKLRTALKLNLENLRSDFLHYSTHCTEHDEELVNACMETQSMAEENLINVETLLELTKDSTSEQCRPSTIKLPILQLPTFRGDITDFCEFWDRFESAIGSRDLSNVEKFSYLISCLEGPALEVVKGLSTTNENYTVALDMLKNRYGNKVRVIEAHYEALEKLNRAKNTAVDCRITLNSIQRHLRILRTLGENTDGNHIRAMLRGKFPERIFYELSILRGNNCSSQEVLDGLERIITAMENSTDLNFDKNNKPGSSTEALHVHVKHEKGQQYQKTRKPNNWSKQNTHTEIKNNSFISRKHKQGLSHPANKNDTKRRRQNCIFCGGNHYNDKCNKVKSVEERKKKLNKRCYLCFKEGHFTNDCKKGIKCYHCKEKHNSALCLKEHGNIIKSVVEFNKQTTYTLNVYSNSILQTATVKVQALQNHYHNDCRLLLDSGSQRSYITSGLSNKLKLKADSEDLLIIYTFGSDIPKEIKSPSALINIITKRRVKKQIRVNIVPHITGRISVPDVSQLNYNMIDILADDGSAEQQIDLLIGSNYYFSFIRGEKIKLSDDLYLINTDFGWMLSGILEINKEEENPLSVVTFCQCYCPDYPYFTEPDLPLRNVDIKFLWSLEGIGITDSPKASREEEAVEHFNYTVRYEHGRYQVKWPWVQYPPELPTNFGLAFGRLKGLVKRLDNATIQEYDSIIKEQLKTEIIEEIMEPGNPYQQAASPIHYLPHHIVKHENKKGRIVYDASAKTIGQKSLNENLYRGPSLLEDLTGLLINFRSKAIGMTADVEKAFLQVGLQKDDREVTRFLWLKDISKEPSEDNLVHLRFCRVPFGFISSPFLLTATIRFHMSKEHPQLLNEIANKIYVDNLISGANTFEEAKRLYNETRRVFKELSMNIRDWTTNDATLRKEFTEASSNNQNEVKVLGLKWNLKEDTLQLNYTKPKLQDKATKRIVLCTLARVYDPCGLVAPLILPAKILFQELCKRKFKWDDIIPADLETSWMESLSNLELVNDVQVPRYASKELKQDDTEYELHAFADASKHAYAAVVYLRTFSVKEAYSNLIMAKSRVTPLKDQDELKIPRLELLGNLIANRLLHYVEKNLELRIARKYLWTDSKIVLSWINSDKLLPPFVARRVEELKRNQDVIHLYVNTEINPADLATRQGLWKQKQELWSHGPHFLAEDKSTWPSNTFSGEVALTFPVAEGLPASGSDMEEEMEHVSQPAISQDKEKNYNSVGNKDTEEIRQIKELQQQYFSTEIEGKETHLTRNLGLFLDIDGLLRCKGRMSNTCWAYDMKHPILLPKNCEFTNNLIKTTHEKNYHVGTAHTLSLIRRKYWIPQGRAQTKKVISRCLQCQKHTAGPYKLPMPPALPAERVNYSSPFTYTGVDYLGPIFVSTETDRSKRWICLFTCLAVRATHLEIVNDLTAEECLLSLRRFIACRGVPQVIVSDNGTQFRLTSNVLLDSYCIKNKIAWKFIPQLAPWHGGFYERLVALVKNCLKRTLEKHLLNDSQMVTVVKEVEAIINTRPLTNIGSDLESVLRPSDFLSLGKCLTTEMSEKDFTQQRTETKRNLVVAWKRGQKIVEEFKDMFVNQYLVSLRERYSHSHKQPRVTSHRTPCVGDVVQVKGDSKNRSNWRVGKIIELIKGSDGQCRVAKIRIGDSIFVRSIGHLYPLEIEEDLCVAQENEPFVKDVAQEEQHIEIQVPEEIHVEPQLPEDTPVEQIPEEQPEIPQLISEDSLSEIPEALDNMRIEPEEEEPDHEDDTRPEEDRVRRGAAIRAREKIAEWTRHLVALI